jgi:chaperonin GroEL (HSP60 family)
MDKLIVDNHGKSTISNDGATIMKLLDIVHPAAKTLVDIAKSQDAEVGVLSDLVLGEVNEMKNNIIKSSRATSHVKWLSKENANASRTISVLVLRLLSSVT